VVFIAAAALHINNRRFVDQYSLHTVDFNALFSAPLTFLQAAIRLIATFGIF
jgi:hypothetical protein